MTNENGIKYFCLGLGLGVATGILWAPKAGADTRNYLRNRASDGTEYINDQAKVAADTAINAVERGKDTVRRHKENLTAAVEAGRTAFREAVATTPNS